LRIDDGRAADQSFVIERSLSLLQSPLAARNTAGAA
jgi:hypothetical protein